MKSIRRKGLIETPSDHISIVISMGNEKQHRAAESSDEL